ncbi:hypothetical protein [Microbulbifer sp. NBRC 101763]|uniref:IS66 family insertion sequence element accessory protein TnpA n=1 Tax=Microbulbifer sp. NBRC 101763 TaxID=1113820 RepID=UPI003341AA3A
MNQQQWQSHVSACEKSSQSKRAYTRKHNLNYSQFPYWYRKLSDKRLCLISPTLFPWISSPYSH